METEKAAGNDLIVGSKGKGGGGSSYRAPVEEHDSLQAVQYVSLLDVLSEGPIVGLVDGDKSIYLNETPLRTSGGTLTLSDVSWQINTGTPDQKALPYASGAETETGVGVEVTHLSPKGEGPDSGKYQFSIANADDTRLRITLGVQGLYQQLTDQAHAGDVVGASVSYRITITDANNSTIKSYSRTLKGKTTSQYFWDLTFALSGEAPWLVTVEKTSEDSSSSTLVNNLYLSSYTEIIGYSFTYPNTAMIAMKASAETFGGSVPNRLYYVKGLKVQVPSNYDPETRSYSGVWNGTFKLAWTDNPAWVLYDMITNDRYGVCKYLPHSYLNANELCDKWYLYRIAQICDELVDDGFGGKEPRYTFNYQIQGAGEAKEVIQSIASTFHGMTYWSSGLIYARADFTDDPVRTISQANVKDGVFTYSSASQQERHSVALVKWNDPEDLGRTHVEAVYDWEAYRRLGYRPIETVAYGCYSRGQAHRHGKWLLASEETPWTVTVEMGLDGFDLVPGDIVKVSDPSWMGYRASGRTKGISETTVTLDAAFDTSKGEAYQISICDTDGTEETRQIVAVDGASVTVGIAFTHTFADNAIWSISGSSAQPRQFRVQNIKETSKASIQLTLIEIDPNKFRWIEENLRIELPPSRRPLKAECLPPDNLSVTERTATVNAQLVQKALFSWSYSSANFAVTQYRVCYVDALGDKHYSRWQSENSFELTNVQTGAWRFSVQAKTFDGRTSSWSSTNYEMAGISALSPANADSLSLEEWGYMQKDGVHVSNVDVKWTPPSGMKQEALEGFDIYYRYSSSAKWQKYVTTEADETEHTLENVLTGRTIQILLRTRSRLGVLSSGLSDSLQIVGKDAPPAAPQNFTVEQNPRDRTQLLCSWSAVDEPDIAGYRLRLDGSVVHNLTPGTAATITLTRSGEHTVQLRTVDNSQQQSSPVSHTGTYAIEPQDVTNFAVAQSTLKKSSLVFSWDAVPGADIDYYEIRQGKDYGEASLVARVQGTTFTLENWTDEGIFTFGIKAHCLGGHESQYPSYYALTVSMRPSPPSHLTASQSSADPAIVNVSWWASPDLDVTSYEIRDGLVWEDAALIGTTSGTMLTINCSASHEFNFLVRANNSAGYASDLVSAFCEATLEPPLVTGFNAVQDGDAVDLWWDKSPSNGVDWYELREGLNWDSGSLIASGISTTNASTPVSFERNYRFMVKAHSRTGYYSDQPARALLSVDNLSPKNVVEERDFIALREDGTQTHDNSRFVENPCTWATVGGQWSDYPDKRWIDFGGQYVLSLAEGETSGVWTGTEINMMRDVKAKIAADFQLLNSLGATARLQYRSRTIAAADWGPWIDLKEHTETLSKIQFRVVMNAQNVANPPYVVLLKVVVDMPDVIKSGRTAVPAEGMTIPYGFEYAISPTVVVTADTATARAVLEGVPGASDFTVKIFDTNNSPIAGTVNWTSYGY